MLRRTPVCHPAGHRRRQRRSRQPRACRRQHALLSRRLLPLPLPRAKAHGNIAVGDPPRRALLQVRDPLLPSRLSLLRQLPLVRLRRHRKVASHLRLKCRSVTLLFAECSGQLLRHLVG
eukprot:scaffold79414_cov60-Phaeocystis_antarctica.AAC.6